MQEKNFISNRFDRAEIALHDIYKVLMREEGHEAEEEAMEDLFVVLDSVRTAVARIKAV